MAAPSAAASAGAAFVDAVVGQVQAVELRVGELRRGEEQRRRAAAEEASGVAARIGRLDARVGDLAAAVDAKPGPEGLADHERRLAKLEEDSGATAAATAELREAVEAHAATLRDVAAASQQATEAVGRVERQQERLHAQMQEIRGLVQQFAKESGTQQMQEIMKCRKEVQRMERRTRQLEEQMQELSSQPPAPTNGSSPLDRMRAQLMSGQFGGDGDDDDQPLALMQREGAEPQDRRPAGSSEAAYDALSAAAPAPPDPPADAAPSTPGAPRRGSGPVLVPASRRRRVAPEGGDPPYSDIPGNADKPAEERHDDRWGAQAGGQPGTVTPGSVSRRDREWPGGRGGGSGAPAAPPPPPPPQPPHAQPQQPPPPQQPQDGRPTLLKVKQPPPPPPPRPPQPRRSGPGGEGGGPPALGPPAPSVEAPPQPPLQPLQPRPLPGAAQYQQPPPLSPAHAGGSSAGGSPGGSAGGYAAGGGAGAGYPEAAARNTGLQTFKLTKGPQGRLGMRLNGSLIHAVVSGSVAEIAGLVSGMTLISVASVKVAGLSDDEIRGVLASAGDPVTVEVLPPKAEPPPQPPW